MRVTIDHIGVRGDGVADGPIYIPYAVDGDELEVKIKGKQGRISHIHKPSAHRITPLCQHFTRCGGCALQHVSEEYYINWKQQQIRTALSHRGFEDVTILAPEISPLGSRRRARLSVIGGKVIGFNERASHNIIDMQECPVLMPEIMKFIAPLRKFLGTQLRKNQKMTVRVTHGENGLDVILEGAGEPDLDMRMDIAAFAEQNDLARVCWLNIKQKDPYAEILAERRKPYISFDGRRVFMPPGSFLQATKEGEIALTRYVKNALKDAGKLVDIFAGCGTFSVSMLADHGVHAVEGNGEMLAALKQSVGQMGAIRTLTTELRDLYLRPLLAHELDRFDGAIIDPPRAGARDQMAEIVKSQIGKLVMISCNPASFARDARILADGGFALGEILPVDQFLYSPHLEVIAAFSRQ